MSALDTERDAALIRNEAGGEAEIAIVLGSGLNNVAGHRFAHARIAYDRLESIAFKPLEGHEGAVLAGTWNGRRVAIFAGRAHLYQGFSPVQVTSSVRLAKALGARVLCLTNAAGALNPAFAAGDLMLVSDHLNLTGMTPLEGQRFTDMTGAYSQRLRALLRERATPESRLREGIYAGVRGPSYETPAEGRYLRLIGGDAVGMSTVLETIAARALGLEVMAISVITNAVGPAAVQHAEVTRAAEAAASRLSGLIDRALPKV